MRTALSVGSIVVLLCLSGSLPVFAAGPDCGTAVGASCCLNVVTNTQYCLNNLICETGVCKN